MTSENKPLRDDALEATLRQELLQALQQALPETPLQKSDTKIGATKVAADLGDEAITTFSLEPERLFVVISLPQTLAEQANAIEKLVQATLEPHLAGRKLALVLTSSATSTREQETRQKRKTPPQPTARQGGIARVKTILGVASGKGGVGKSTLAVNLSIALAQLSKPDGLPRRVGLLDADLYGPSLVRMLALDKPPQRNKEGLIIPEKRFGISTLSMGSMMEHGQALVWRGPLIGRALKQLLEGTEWGDLDLLLLDLPPGTGDLPLTLAQSASLDAAMLVSTPQQVALYDVRKSHNMFNKLRIPVVGIVENMSLFQCPHCGQSSAIFGSGGSEEEASATKIPFLGRLPISQALQESGDKAAPIMATEIDTAATNRDKFVTDAKQPQSTRTTRETNSDSMLERARSLHLQELCESMRSITAMLALQLEGLQKNHPIVE